MSQRQLAALLATPDDGDASERQIENMRRQVSSWINDAHAPSPENATRIAEALDVPADWLVDDTPRRSLPSALEELAKAIEMLTRRAEEEEARSEEAAQLVRALDHRLEHNEALLRQLIEGQTTAAAALEEILERLDDGESGSRSRARAR